MAQAHKISNPVTPNEEYLAAILEELKKLNQLLADQNNKNKQIQVSGDPVEMKEPKQTPKSKKKR